MFIENLLVTPFFYFCDTLAKGWGTLCVHWDCSNYIVMRLTLELWERRIDQLLMMERGIAIIVGVSPVAPTWVRTLSNKKAGLPSSTPPMESWVRAPCACMLHMRARKCCYISSSTRYVFIV